MTQNSINNRASDFTVDNLFLNGNTISSTDTNGNIILAPDGSGVVSVTAAAIEPSTDRADSLGSATNSWDNVYCDGITFDDGTNILGNYVNTTSFTPEIQFGGASTGITYSSQTGRYLRIGNLVWVYVSIQLSNKGSATGNMTITGLPITQAASVTSFLSGRWNNVTLGANQTYIAYFVQSATATIQTRQCGNNTPDGGQISDASCTNNSIFTITGVMITS